MMVKLGTQHLEIAWRLRGPDHMDLICCALMFQITQLRIPYGKCR
jgi:hypothetical protein